MERASIGNLEGGGTVVIFKHAERKEECKLAWHRGSENGQGSERRRRRRRRRKRRSEAEGGSTVREKEGAAQEDVHSM